MRDILNNFIYGIQLMSGRLRAGDWVECDGVRGKVSSVSYQSTQIETLDGAVISFLNTALFNKNFKNLTRSNPYEFTKIVVGVKYGTDIEKARQVLVEAMKPLQGTDDSGMKIVDEKLGVYVTVEEFGANSVDIAVKQFVLVPQRNSYLARAREVIYNALKEAGIEIPFPQRDIHIINE
jgi:small-conductance mechanosensitive channel